MAIENEIVKFVAQMELDPQTTSEFTQGLKDADSRANELRETISRTTAELTKMRIEGKEGTDQFKALEAGLKADTKALRDAQSKAEQYGKALGINQMSIKELNNHAKNLRAALYSMHKEADPKTWEKYQRELKATEARMKELKGGSEKTGGVLKGLGSKIAGGFALGTIAIKALNGVVALAKKGFQDFTKATQTWGDRWNVATQMASAGWQQFIANIAQGNNVIKGSISEAMKAARDAAILRDELFERNNSYKIMEADAKIYMNTQQAIANDASKSAEERLQALNNILEKEEELATTRKNIAEQDRTAALEVLQTRTQMSEEQLKYVVDEYEKNRDVIQQAGEYNKLLEEQSRLMNTRVDSYGAAVYYEKSVAPRLEEIKKALAGYGDTIVNVAALTRQYNLANDDLVKSYVDATLAVKSADEALTQATAGQAKKRGALNNQIANDAKAQREKDYKNRTDAADKAYKQELNALKEARIKGDITETEFRVKSEAAETAYINNKIAINKAYGKDTIDLETKLVDKRLELQKRLEAALAKDEDFSRRMAEQIEADSAAVSQMLEDELGDIEIDDSSIKEFLEHIQELTEKAKYDAVGTKAKIELATEQRDSDLADLEEMHQMQLISEEEYLERRKQLNADYSKQIAGIVTESWQNAAATASQFLNQMGALVSAVKDAETESLEAQMQAELAAAGDNAEARAAIEEKYEAKKLDTQKKYADVEMAINIGKTIADGALAVMKSFADLGPIAGGIMAALIAATTVAQVAVIVAQRNSIKNASAGAGGSTASAAGNVQGFSEGGYTGKGERLEVAGVVHKGEYVVPQPELRDPQVASMVASIESKRRARTSKNALPGFAEGGYTEDNEGTAAANENNAILAAIYGLLQNIAAEPVQAYVVLSQLEAQKDRQQRFKSITSLNR